MATTRHTPPQWLDDAVFYEIYPQSFADSNGDGIGDIPGIISRLDYIADLGATALWINPCWDSPFKDAGYDVRDYLKVAPRYGTNDDLIRLFGEAHRRGIRVLLDLVPGHTSEEHPWFRSSCQVEPNEYSDRYIWTDFWLGNADGLPFIAGEAPRSGMYILNFFKCQPALNYGFAHPHLPWQIQAGTGAALKTEEAMVNVMRFWLSRGADGFRVDMANSLVKGDDDAKTATTAAWKRMFAPIREEFPQAAFVAEWGCPAQAIPAGFDMDFYLDWRFNGQPNGYNYLLRNTDTTLSRTNDRSYFNADSGAPITGFLEQYEPQIDQLRDITSKGGNRGYFSLLTCNHDTPRCAPRLTGRELKVAYAMLLTMPGVPFIYYGDEIGMRYRSLPTKEGGYDRTGTRTPMQWDGTANAGFSSATAEKLYLPVDPATDAPNAAAESTDPDSLLAWVKRIVALKHSIPALQANGAFHVLWAPKDGRAFIYLRSKATETGTSYAVIAVNPGKSTEKYDLRKNKQPLIETPALKAHAAKAASESNADPDASVAEVAPRKKRSITPALSIGDVALLDDVLYLGPQSAAVFTLPTK